MSQDQTGSQVMPNHLVVVPDGNRRWAKEKGLNPWEGHVEGAKRYEEAIEAAFLSGVKYFTFWAASEDNVLKRSSVEVQVVLNLFRDELTKGLASSTFEKNQIQVRVIGRYRELIKDEKLNQAISDLENKTAKFTERHLTILFCYDGRSEMLAAQESLRVSSEPVTAESLQKNLWTGFLPPVDLVIRTGGEPHWSAGLLMWLTANSQFYFTPDYWPSFTPEKLKIALDDYASRGRRFGA